MVRFWDIHHWKVQSYCHQIQWTVVFVVPIPQELFAKKWMGKQKFGYSRSWSSSFWCKYKSSEAKPKRLLIRNHRMPSRLGQLYMSQNSKWHAHEHTVKIKVAIQRGQVILLVNDIDCAGQRSRLGVYWRWRRWLVGKYFKSLMYKMPMQNSRESWYRMK